MERTNLLEKRNRSCNSGTRPRPAQKRDLRAKNIGDFGCVKQIIIVYYYYTIVYQMKEAILMVENNSN